MKKQMIKIEIPFNFSWVFRVELKKMREDLDELEKMGVTEIEILPYDSWGSTSIEIKAFKNRLETDEEYKIRIQKENKRKEEIKRIELEQLERLKLKYNQLD